MVPQRRQTHFCSASQLSLTAEYKHWKTEKVIFVCHVSSEMPITVRTVSKRVFGFIKSKNSTIRKWQLWASTSKRRHASTRLSMSGSKWCLHMFGLTAAVPSVYHYHVDRTAAQVNYHDNRLITPIRCHWEYWIYTHENVYVLHLTAAGSGSFWQGYGLWSWKAVNKRPTLDSCLCVSVQMCVRDLWE